MANIDTSAGRLVGKAPLLELTHIEQSEKLDTRVPVSRKAGWLVFSPALLPDTGGSYLSTPQFAD